jgi:hypothetical protein
MTGPSAFDPSLATNGIARPAAGLEPLLERVESRLAALGDALHKQDLPAIELESGELHRALAQAVDHFTRAARSGPIDPTLRRRLAHTSGHVAAHRESFARATAALDRAIDVLLPAHQRPGFYAASGSAARTSLGGVIAA